MDEKRCSCCAKKLPLSSFLADASADMRSKVFATCISCRERARSKRKAAQPPTHPRQHSKHTSIDYCSRCRHTLPHSAFTSISIAPGDNTLKTCSSCRYRSRRSSIIPSAASSYLNLLLLPIFLYNHLFGQCCLHLSYDLCCLDQSLSQSYLSKPLYQLYHSQLHRSQLRYNQLRHS